MFAERHSRWWRGGEGSPWVCAICHPVPRCGRCGGTVILAEETADARRSLVGAPLEACACAARSTTPSESPLTVGEEQPSTRVTRRPKSKSAKPKQRGDDLPTTLF